MEQQEIYDVLIIGAGPGGLTAALYASRANLSVLVLERGVPGGELINTADIENYPGYDLISGPDLADKMYQSAMRFGAKHQYGDVTALDLSQDVKVVTAGDKEYRAYSVILATGAHHRKLAVPGEDAYAGRGVSYCAVCDGAFFRGRDLVVVGGGDSAVEEGTYLTQFARSVTIVHRRDQLRAQQILQERAFKNEAIRFVWNHVVEEIVGDGQQVTAVRLRDVTTDAIQELPTDGVFIYVGLLPNSAAFADQGITDDEGWVETNANMHTRIPGVFAIGDVRQKNLRQVVTAVGDGGQAGQEAYLYVTELKETLEAKHG